MYAIEWTLKAYRQARKIRDAATRSKIVSAVEGLATFPDTGSVVKLRAGINTD